MKISQISCDDAINFMRNDIAEFSIADLALLAAEIDAARAYVAGYTGLSSDEIDEHNDFAIAVYVLVQDMYDNRTLYVDKTNINRVVDSILGMHRVNLV